MFSQHKKTILTLSLLSLLAFGFSPPPEPPTMDVELEELAPRQEVQAIVDLSEARQEYENERLLWKQEALRELGWYKGQVDGIHGPLTENAIQEAADAADIEPVAHKLIGAIVENEVPEAPQPPPEPSPEPQSSSTAAIEWHWLELARCESGNWVNGGESFTGPIRWNWGAPGMTIPPWGTNIHSGGFQFADSTWSWIAPMVGLGHIRFAYEATPQEQLQVAKKVQELQGFEAWPVCARKIGLIN